MTTSYLCPGIDTFPEMISLNAFVLDSVNRSLGTHQQPWHLSPSPVISWYRESCIQLLWAGAGVPHSCAHTLSPSPSVLTNCAMRKPSVSSPLSWLQSLDSLVWVFSCILVDCYTHAPCLSHLCVCTTATECGQVMFGQWKTANMTTVDSASVLGSHSRVYNS
jgi:hypothetical protein